MSFKYAIALTGGIATGKSTVCAYFKAQNFTVIDADKIAHTILNEKKESIAKMFGSDMIKEDKVNRKKLGILIFKNQTKRVILENLLHPLIFSKIEDLAIIEDALKKSYLIDIPLFFEKRSYPIKKSIVVYTSREEQIKRLMKRDGYSKKDAQIRIDTQLDIESKRIKATYVIDNSRNEEHLKKECERVKERILKECV